MKKKHATPTDVIRAAINDSGMSRYQLAKLSGVTEAALSRFMTGTTGMKVSTLDRLAPFLGVKIIVERPKQ